MPLPASTPKRDLFRRPMIATRLGPAQEHENLYAHRCDTGFSKLATDISCPAMFESMVRTMRHEPGCEPVFLPVASEYMETQ